MKIQNETQQTPTKTTAYTQYSFSYQMEELELSYMSVSWGIDMAMDRFVVICTFDTGVQG
jgi:hypothetical protein